MTARANEPIVIFVTASSKDEAATIADVLLKAKAVACVNILPGVESRYWWEGKLEQAQEVMLIAKTTREAFPKVEALVKAHHSYQVPEIIALPIIEGHAPYLAWLKENSKA